MERALRWARAAVEIHASRCPNPDACVAGWYPSKHLAIVQYRAGNFEDALATLARCESIWRESERIQRPNSHATPENALDQAFIAMSHWRLGHEAEARAALAKAKEVVGSPDQLVVDAKAAIAEAAAMMGK